jgi:hypothetical protein
MKITNKTRKTVIADNAKEARSFLSRARGLMLARTPQTLVITAPDQSIEETSIHMWFMLFPIDVIWLDSRLKVVDTFKGAKPWSFRIFRPELSAKYVVECPVGTITKTKTRAEDDFSFG